MHIHTNLNCINCLGLLLAIALHSSAVNAQATQPENFQFARQSNSVFPDRIASPQTDCPLRMDKKWQIVLSTGYQQQNFHWSIAGNSNGQNPNVYSELKWQHLSGPAFNMSVQYHVWKGFSLFANGSHTSIVSGKVNDTDYEGDNRTYPVYQGKFDSDKGSMSSWSAGAGYTILNYKKFHLTSLIGYGVNYQSLYLLDHSGTFGNLHSNYSSNWHGPLIKLIAALSISHTMTLSADLMYHQVSYSAKADWNLITQFSHPVSFRQAADGYGINADAGLTINLGQHFMLRMKAGYNNWQTGTGTDRLYLASGQTSSTQLNEAVTDGFECTAGLGFSF